MILIGGFEVRFSIGFINSLSTFIDFLLVSSIRCQHLLIFIDFWQVFLACHGGTAVVGMDNYVRFHELKTTNFNQY